MAVIIIKPFLTTCTPVVHCLHYVKILALQALNLVSMGVVELLSKDSLSLVRFYSILVLRPFRMYSLTPRR